MFWPNSTVYHAVCKNSVGPFIIKDTIGPGHNPEAFRLKDGRVVVYVIDGYYIWKKTVYKPGAFNQVIPFDGTRSFGDLGIYILHTEPTGS